MAIRYFIFYQSLFYECFTKFSLNIKIKSHNLSASLSEQF